MIDALKDRKIDSCKMDADMFSYLQQTRFDLDLYRIEVLDKQPFVIAVKKEEEVFPVFTTIA